MGTTGFGRLLSEGADVARYEFGPEPSSVRGVLVIPLDDPEQWYVEGQEERSVLARNVLHKALRLRRRDGVWPRDASFFS
ncbi:hypothetical protein [Cellulomonas sp. Y8]|uniref:hypothetical protein n=1 Tax=Cellulomonas sp. Y8 TaxID=2591145 RepID=UPI003D70B682